VASIILPNTSAYKYPRFPVAARKRGTNIGASLNSSSVNNGDILTSIVGAWNFETHTTGYPAVIGGAANTLFDLGNTGSVVAGKISNAASILARTEHSPLNSAYAFAGGQMSCGFWLRFPVLPVAVDHDIISAVAGANTGYILRLTPAGQLQFYVSILGVGYNAVNWTAFNLSINTWYFVALYFNDATLAISVSTSASFSAFNTAANTGTYDSTGVGLILKTGAETMLFDTMAFYSRVLALDDWTTMWNNGNGVSF